MDTSKLISKLDATVTVREMINLLGGCVYNYPIIGNTIVLNGKRSCERDLTGNGTVDIAYDWQGNSIDEQKLTYIYIGTKYTGIMLQASKNESGEWIWRNCYSNGNFGSNYSHGGKWSSEGATGRSYKTIEEALKNRDFKVRDITMQNQYTEGDSCKKLILDFINQ